MSGAAVGARVPRASIIVPSYDHGPFVLGAVRSALDQTEPDVEVLVIDDGSTDDSMARLATLDDPRVTVLQHPNRGLSRTLNRGLALARAPWVKFLPSDDMLAPACIERELAAAKAPGTGVVFCLPEVVDAYGHPLADPAPEAWFDTAARDDRSILPGLVERNFLCAPGALFDRDLAREVGGFDPDMKVAQDYDLWLRLLVRRRARLLPERLVRVRWHGSNQSAVATPSTEAERARALLRAVAPGTRDAWIRRFAGDAVGRRGEVVGRRAFAGALLRSGVPDVRALAAELDREADALARGGVAGRVVRMLGGGMRGAVGVARRRLRPRWMRAAGTSSESPPAAPRSRASAPASGLPGESAGAQGSSPLPTWIVLDPSPVPAGEESRATRIAEALASRGAPVALAGEPGRDAGGRGPQGAARARRVAGTLASLRAELDASTGRVCVLVGAPHPVAIAFAREARQAGARVVYDRARAWEGVPDLAWRPDGERALVALADDVVAAKRPLAALASGAGRIVHLLVAPDGDVVDDGSWERIAESLLQATRRPTVAMVGHAAPGEELRSVESLAAAASRHGELAIRATVVSEAPLTAAAPGADVDGIAERARVGFVRCAVPGIWAAQRLGIETTGSEVVVFVEPGNGGPDPAGLLQAVDALAADGGLGAVAIEVDDATPGNRGPDVSPGTGGRGSLAEFEPGGEPARPIVLACSRRALARTPLAEKGPSGRGEADRALVRSLRAAGFRVERVAR